MVTVPIFQNKQFFTDLSKCNLAIYQKLATLQVHTRRYIDQKLLFLRFHVIFFLQDEVYYQSLMKISSPRPPPLASSSRPETSSSSSSLFSNSSFLTFSNADQDNLKKHIIEVCESKKNLSMLKWELLKNQFMVDQDHKIAYCRHGKVSTFEKNCIAFLLFSTFFCSSQ